MARDDAEHGNWTVGIKDGLEDFVTLEFTELSEDGFDIFEVALCSSSAREIAAALLEFADEAEENAI